MGAQATVAQPFTLSGRGLHTGLSSSVTVGPAEVGTGIVFRRSGIAPRPIEVAAVWQNRCSQPLCTALTVSGRVVVRTIEHLMASLSAFEIDNAMVDIDAEELPIFDGSALSWCHALARAGRRELDKERRYIRIREPVEVASGNKLLRIEPSPSLSLDVTMDLAGYGEMRWQGPVNRSTFVNELAMARSFGRLKWALPLKLFHLFSGQPILRGAHFGNVAAIFGGRIVGGMRIPAEPVRHRALDLIGDLALTGAPVLGHVIALRPGHEINFALVKAVVERQSAWEFVEASLLSSAAGVGQ